MEESQNYDMRVRLATSTQVPTLNQGVKNRAKWYAKFAHICNRWEKGKAGNLYANLLLKGCNK